MQIDMHEEEKTNETVRVTEPGPFLILIHAFKLPLPTFHKIKIQEKLTAPHQSLIDALPIPLRHVQAEAETDVTGYFTETSEKRLASKPKINSYSTQHCLGNLY